MQMIFMFAFRLIGLSDTIRLFDCVFDFDNLACNAFNDRLP